MDLFILASIIFSLPLLIYPVLAIVNSIKKRKREGVLTGTGVLFAFFGFFILAGAAISPYPSIPVKMVFLVVFGAGNALSWPLTIKHLASASSKEDRLFYLLLSVLPIISLWVLIFILKMEGHAYACS